MVCAFAEGPAKVGVGMAPAKGAAQMLEKLRVAENAAEGVVWLLCANILTVDLTAFKECLEGVYEGVGVSHAIPSNT
jgi:hypothetical protein